MPYPFEKQSVSNLIALINKDYFNSADADYYLNPPGKGYMSETRIKDTSVSNVELQVMVWLWRIQRYFLVSLDDQSDNGKTNTVLNIVSFLLLLPMIPTETVKYLCTDPAALNCLVFSLLVTRDEGVWKTTLELIEQHNSQSLLLPLLRWCYNYYFDKAGASYDQVITELMAMHKDKTSFDLPASPVTAVFRYVPIAQKQMKKLTVLSAASLPAEITSDSASTSTSSTQYSDQEISESDAKQFHISLIEQGIEVETLTYHNKSIRKLLFTLLGYNFLTEKIYPRHPVDLFNTSQFKLFLSKMIEMYLSDTSQITQVVQLKSLSQMIQFYRPRTPIYGAKNYLDAVVIVERLIEKEEYHEAYLLYTDITTPGIIYELKTEIRARAALYCFMSNVAVWLKSDEPKTVLSDSELELLPYIRTVKKSVPEKAIPTAQLFKLAQGLAHRFQETKHKIARNNARNYFKLIDDLLRPSDLIVVKNLFVVAKGKKSSQQVSPPVNHVIDAPITTADTLVSVGGTEKTEEVLAPLEIKQGSVVCEKGGEKLDAAPVPDKKEPVAKKEKTEPAPATAPAKKETVATAKKVKTEPAPTTAPAKKETATTAKQEKTETPPATAPTKKESEVISKKKMLEETTVSIPATEKWVVVSKKDKKQAAPAVVVNNPAPLTTAPATAPAKKESVTLAKKEKTESASVTTPAKKETVAIATREKTETAPAKVPTKKESEAIVEKEMLEETPGRIPATEEWVVVSKKDKKQAAPAVVVNNPDPLPVAQSSAVVPRKKETVFVHRPITLDLCLLAAKKSPATVQASSSSASTSTRQWQSVETTAEPEVESKWPSLAVAAETKPKNSAGRRRPLAKVEESPATLFPSQKPEPVVQIDETQVQGKASTSVSTYKEQIPEIRTDNKTALILPVLVPNQTVTVPVAVEKTDVPGSNLATVEPNVSLPIAPIIDTSSMDAPSITGDKSPQTSATSSGAPTPNTIRRWQPIEPQPTTVDGGLWPALNAASELLLKGKKEQKTVKITNSSVTFFASQTSATSVATSNESREKTQSIIRSALPPKLLGVIDFLREDNPAARIYLTGAAPSNILDGKKPNDYDVLILNADIPTIYSQLNKMELPKNEVRGVKHPIIYCEVGDGINIDFTVELLKADETIETRLEADFFIRDLNVNALYSEFTKAAAFPVFSFRDALKTRNEKRLVSINEPKAAFDADPTKLIRLVKVLTGSSDYVIDENLQQAINDLKGNWLALFKSYISRESGNIHRLDHALKKLFSRHDYAEINKTLDDMGALQELCGNTLSEANLACSRIPNVSPEDRFFYWVQANSLGRSGLSSIHSAVYGLKGKWVDLLQLYLAEECGNIPQINQALQKLYARPDFFVLNKIILDIKPLLEFNVNILYARARSKSVSVINCFVYWVLAKTIDKAERELKEALCPIKPILVLSPRETELMTYIQDTVCGIAPEGQVYDSYILSLMNGFRTPPEVSRLAPTF